jgi:ceramide glucosyltransferase
MSSIFFLLALVSCGVALVLMAAQLSVLGEMPRQEGGRPIAVSILKPLKGADPGLEKNLESFFRLDCAEYEVVFSFADDSDPALPIARRVADAHPEVPATFVVGGGEPGQNPKVCRLLAALSRARHPLVLISDGDVRVRPDFLVESAAPFEDPAVGLVSNLFVGRGGENLGARLENLHLNGFVFGGTAAVSRIARRPCVVGKSMMLSREALAWIGGLASVKDFLAEDYLLGEAVVRAGFRVVLSPHVVSAHCEGKPVRAFWDRHLRWARMRKKLAGPTYLLESLASPAPWALLALASPGPAPFRLAAAALIAVKVAAEAAVMRRLGAGPRLSDLPLIVVKDLLAFGVFWAGLLGNRTVWRGKQVRLGARTRLEAA